MKGIFEDDCVRTTRDEAESLWPRATDSWEAVTWTLVHDETCGRPLNEQGTIRGYVWDGARSAKLPSVEVIYEIQNTDIVIRDARFFEAPYHHHGRA